MLAELSKPKKSKRPKGTEPAGLDTPTEVLLTCPQ